MAPAAARDRHREVVEDQQRAIRWLDEAAMDLYRELRKRDERPGQKFHQAVTKTTTLLASSPYLGRAGRVPGTREAIVPGEGVIVVYQEPDDVLEYEIRILALRDARRQWPNSFKGL